MNILGAEKRKSWVTGGPYEVMGGLDFDAALDQQTDQWDVMGLLDQIPHRLPEIEAAIKTEVAGFASYGRYVQWFDRKAGNQYCKMFDTKNCMLGDGRRFVVFGNLDGHAVVAVWINTGWGAPFNVYVFKDDCETMDLEWHLTVAKASLYCPCSFYDLELQRYHPSLAMYEDGNDCALDVTEDVNERGKFVLYDGVLYCYKCGEPLQFEWDYAYE